MALHPISTFPFFSMTMKMDHVYELSFSIPRRKIKGRLVVGGGRRRLEVMTNGGGETGSVVDIPVTCFQVIGVESRAEKDEVVKSVMNLKNAEVEEGYTMDTVLSRQELLMDVRDKLLFEPEYAGNMKERIPPRSPLRIPWSWLPGALCILQEVGEGKMVLEIGRAVLQHSNSKPYVHDVILAMALAECETAKSWFEEKKISQGFEALARAQYLLRSKDSLGKMPLLLQIEESLEELAPACTLEILGGSHSSENAERRRGAMAALRELVRQGLDVETSCQVKDWPRFLIQALKNLLAFEIVELLPWDSLATTRKNKKSLESQNQRVIIDCDCFYIAIIAHIALGFTTKQFDLISKAKTICECLASSESVDLKFEEAFCSFLLGQGEEAAATERLRQLESNSGPSSRSFSFADKIPDKVSGRVPSLEIWLKDAALGLFPDTRDCSPNMANFFGSSKRSFKNSRQRNGSLGSASNAQRSASYVPSHNISSEEPLSRLNATRNLGIAVKQLAPANLESPLTDCLTPSIQLHRNLGMRHKKVWESLWFSFDIVRNIGLATAVGCFMFIGFRWHITKPKVGTVPLDWTMDSNHKDREYGLGPGPVPTGRRSIEGQLGKLMLMFKRLKLPSDEGRIQNLAPIEVLDKKPMPVEEAEALVKHWQTIKAEALGPDHHVQSLSEVLSESMLTQWEVLAHSAENNSCFWRFVLLQLRILRADIIEDDSSGEKAEIDVFLEEAAELVDESQPKNPNYYSSYKIRYILKRHSDGSWKFCGWSIQN